MAALFFMYIPRVFTGKLYFDLVEKEGSLMGGSLL